MYNSQSQLPTHVRASQATLFHAIQVAEHNSNNNKRNNNNGTDEEDDDDDEYGGTEEPVPSSSEEPATAKEDEEAPAAAAAVAGLVEEGDNNKNETQAIVSQSSPTQSSLNQSVETSSQQQQQPELKLSGGENGASGADEEEQKTQREREHKKRSKNWTRPETLHLIRLRAQLEPRFAKSGRKTELWDEIAEALQREHITRDAQQCRDKWEKLTAGYKEVRDGIKDREDNPFYDELHPLLSGKSMKRERERDEYVRNRDSLGRELTKDMTMSHHEMGQEVAGREKDHRDGGRLDSLRDEDDNEEEADVRPLGRKKKRGQKHMPVTDVAAVQSVLETVVSRQQKFFRDLLDSMERKEMVREQMRLEKEEKWRAEERAHRGIFHNAMIILTQKLVGENISPTMTTAGVAAAATTTTTAPVVVGSPEGPQGPKRRSKNWKRAEVLQLIKLRGEMEARFGKSTRRAGLWDELAELLLVQGIKRDGKQCREKWDKLMAEYKDVSDGKRDQQESPYFAELTSILGRSAEAG
ncbi:unnamed protein product [Sphagnum jensenii]|uniref:Myb-like domain-containing protein n=1 Tax=Sphagnum jensenii TaxID=128206 RepID=A0ABP1BC25_9BRYO